MATCPYCGTDNSPQDAYCRSCGAPLPKQPQAQQPPVSNNVGGQQYYTAGQPNPGAPNMGFTPVPEYANGGLIAWSVVTLLFCTIPGVIALINAVAINKCATVEEQRKKISTTKTCCIVGTILGALWFFFYFFLNVIANL